MTVTLNFDLNLPGKELTKFDGSTGPHTVCIQSIQAVCGDIRVWIRHNNYSCEFGGRIGVQEEPIYIIDSQC